MKLNEIFNTQTKEIKSNKPNFRAFWGNDPEDSGYYSKVVSDVTPHTINKISKKSDPCYDQYVEFLIMRKLPQKNPHFPRIYNVNKYSAGWSKKTLWKMERLPETLKKFLDVHSQDLEDVFYKIQIICDNYLNDTFSKKVNSEIDRVKEAIKNQTINKSGIIHAVDSIIGALTYDYLVLTECLQDGLYKDAIGIVREYNNHIKRCAIDLHPGNIMVRLGKHIPQLVIIDPYASQ